MSNPLYYSREMSKLGVVFPVENEDYLEMVDVFNKNNKLLLLSNDAPLESVNYIVLSNKIVIIDLMTFRDSSSKETIIFEITDYNVNIYKINNDCDINENIFYNNLTNPDVCNIISSVRISEFQKMTQGDFIIFMSSLNGGTGTIELTGNLRKIY